MEEGADPRKQQLIGRVLTSDPVEASALEKTLAAKQGNNTLQITWTHTGDGLTHEFVVCGSNAPMCAPK
ncbi:MAG: hypothetical protein IPM98_05315 [Lewinellaceae bacterium]|nr:hypothetical protein [Lewinellaceae bacterium]